MALVHRFTKDQITKFTINCSTSKQMYTFSKSPRFPEIKRTGYSDTFYTPTYKSTRHAGFGYGNKYDFTRASRGTNPQFYAIKRDFDVNNHRGPMYSFGLSRDSCPITKYDKNSPGPNYDTSRPLGSTAPKYTMNERYHATHTSNFNSTPGPGAYGFGLCINENGKYPSSKVRNIMSMDMGASKSRRFVYGKATGGGLYAAGSYFGRNYNSKFRSNPGFIIGAKLREPTNRNNYPGPGYYTPFSELGMYISKTEANLRNSKQSQNKNKSNKQTNKPAKTEPNDNNDDNNNNNTNTDNTNTNNNKHNNTEANNNEQTYEETENKIS